VIPSTEEHTIVQ